MYLFIAKSSNNKTYYVGRPSTALRKCKPGHVISSVTSTVAFSHFAPFTDL